MLVLTNDIFFNINTCKYSFPYCDSSWPSGTMVWTNVNLHYIRQLSCKSELFWFSGSGKDFEWPHSIFAFLWLSPLWRGPDPLFEAFRVTYTQGWFVPTLIEIGPLVLKIFFNVNTCRNGFPYCGTSQPSGTMISTNLNLYYIRQLSC
jgi:hypothetical protein